MGLNYAGIPWDEGRLFARLKAICSPAGFQAAQRLHGFAQGHHAHFIWRDGPYASITPRFRIGRKEVGVFTLEEWTENKGRFVVNFEYLAKYGQVPLPVLSKLAETLRTIPGVKKEYVGLEVNQFRIRPSLSLDEVLAQPGAVETVQSALTTLLQESNPQR